MFRTSPIVPSCVWSTSRTVSYTHLDVYKRQILYRTNAQSRIFEEAMRKRSMPYRIYGGLSFYQRKEIKDVKMCIRDSTLEEGIVQAGSKI